MSSTSEVRAALAALVASGCTGEAPYTIDLRATGRVVSGRKLDEPPNGATPFAALWTVQVDESIVGGPMTQRTQTGRFLCRVWTRWAADASARADAADALMDDVRRALRSDPRLGNRVATMAVSGAPLFEEMQGARQQYASALLSIVCTWREG